MSFIEVSSDEQVTTIRLCRPPLNILSRAMVRELHDTLVSLTEDRAVGAVILAAEGERAFCAGLDLNERLDEIDSATGPSDSVFAIIDPGRLWRETQWLIRHLPVPVIAAVEGTAVGGGFGLVGVCDVIFASERATFTLTEINVGLLGGSSKAMRMLGPYKARSMFFTGDPVPASEFYRLGAVEELTPPGEAEARARSFAERVALKSPIGLRLAKEAIVRIENMGLEEAYRTEQDYHRRLSGFSDATEAMRSFVEKREPKWTWS